MAAAKAGEELMQISRDEVERMRLLSEEKYILDNQSRRAEVIKIGRKESEAEIAQKNAEIALKDAEIAKKDAEIAQSKIEIAKKLKRAGASSELITQNIGLTLKEIAEL